MSGSDEKVNERMGDRTAIALLKIYTDRELSQPSVIQLYLPIIRSSFVFPRLIERRDDMKPQITLLLLNHVEQALPRQFVAYIARLPIFCGGQDSLIRSGTKTRSGQGRVAERSP
jgi:hypothetical protein